MENQESHITPTFKSKTWDLWSLYKNVQVAGEYMRKVPRMTKIGDIGDVGIYFLITVNIHLPVNLMIIPV